LFLDKEVHDAFALLVTLVIEVINKLEFLVLVKLQPTWGAASIGYPYSRS
jgi:hypothetical protein